MTIHFWIIVSPPNFHRLCVWLMYTFWCINMPAGYGRFSDLNGFVWEFTNIITCLLNLHQTFTNCVSSYWLQLQHTILPYVFVCFGSKKHIEMKSKPLYGYVSGQSTFSFFFLDLPLRCFVKNGIAQITVHFFYVMLSKTSIFLSGGTPRSSKSMANFMILMPFSLFWHILSIR